MPHTNSHEVTTPLDPSALRMPSPARAQPREPLHIVSGEAIALLAYEKYLARGAVDGHDTEDWLAAERELRGS